MADVKRPRRKRAKKSYQEEEEEWYEEDFGEESDSEPSYQPEGAVVIASSHPRSHVMYCIPAPAEVQAPTAPTTSTTTTTDVEDAVISWFEWRCFVALSVALTMKQPSSTR